MADDDFAAAIARDPDDLALRAVWADALQLRGDPRGELIALQLAGATTHAAWVRERMLVAAHGATWAGALGRAFTTQVFRGGMFAGGAISTFDLAALPADPAWSLIRRIGTTTDPSPLLDHPRSRITELELDDDVARRYIATGPERTTITTLAIEGEAGLATAARRFPALATLELAAPQLTERRFARHEVFERIVHLVVPRIDRGMLDELALRAGALRSVDFVAPAARVRFERAVASGPFTRFVAWFDGSISARQAAYRANLLLEELDRAHVDEVEIAFGRKLRASDLIGELTRRLEGMPRLTRADVPWPFVARTTAPRWGGAIRDPRVGFGDHVARAWPTFADDLGVAFDAHSVNERGLPALGKDALATLATRAGEPRTDSLALRRRGSADHVTVYRRTASLHFSVALERTPDEVVAWFVRALERWPTASAALGDRARARDLPLAGYASLPSLWIVALPPPAPDAITDDALRAAGLVPIASPTHRVFAIGDAPADASEERQRAAAAVVVAALDAYYATRGPAWFAPLVKREMAEMMQRSAYLFDRETTSLVAWRRPSGGEFAFRLRPADVPTPQRPWQLTYGQDYEVPQIDEAGVRIYCGHASRWLAERLPR